MRLSWFAGPFDACRMKLHEFEFEFVSEYSNVRHMTCHELEVEHVRADMESDLNQPAPDKHAWTMKDQQASVGPSCHCNPKQPPDPGAPRKQHQSHHWRRNKHDLL